MQKQLDTSRTPLQDSPAYQLRAESRDAVHVLLIGVDEQTDMKLRRRCQRLTEVDIQLRSRVHDTRTPVNVRPSGFDVIVIGDSHQEDIEAVARSQLSEAYSNIAVILMGDIADAITDSIQHARISTVSVPARLDTDELLLRILECASFDELEFEQARLGDWCLPCAAEGVVLVDAASRIVYANRAARRRTRSGLQRLIEFVAERGWPNNESLDTEIRYPANQSDVRATYLEWEGARYTVVRLNAPLLRVADSSGRYRGQIERNTGLPDRELFSVICAESIQQAAKHSESLALLIISLDQLPMLRGAVSESAYLSMLRGYARRIRESLRSDDYVACLGTQEFGVLLHGTAESEGVSDIARKLQTSLEREMTVLNEEVRTTTSIGVSLFPFDGRRIEELMRAADLALNRARSRRENPCEFYNPEISNHLRERLILEQRLRRALAEDQYFLHYQPIVLPETGHLVGAEALLRLRDSDSVTTMPGVFIPMLEETGLICEVGRWAINEACRQLRVWHENGFDDFYVSVNISPRQFADDGLCDFILQSLDAHGVPPCGLLLEVTENVLMSDPLHAGELLGRLKEAGVHTAIDDFGTGYSSMAYLKHLPVSAIKVDRAFVRNLPEDQDDAAITLSLIDLARHMGLWLIAEGVEDDAQRVYLKRQGVELMQGFLFGRPMPGSHILERLNTEPEEPEFPELE